jgi:hypothetical protein
MPLLTTIIARVLAISDYLLAQWVDVAPVTNVSPNGCWQFEVQNATLNACGQERILANIVEGWADLLAETTILIPSLLAF